MHTLERDLRSLIFSNFPRMGAVIESSENRKWQIQSASVVAGKNRLLPIRCCPFVLLTNEMLCLIRVHSPRIPPLYFIDLQVMLINIMFKIGRFLRSRLAWDDWSCHCCPIRWLETAHRRGKFRKTCSKLRTYRLNAQILDFLGVSIVILPPFYSYEVYEHGCISPTCNNPFELFNGCPLSPIGDPWAVTNREGHILIDFKTYRMEHLISDEGIKKLSFIRFYWKTQKEHATRNL